MRVNEVAHDVLNHLLDQQKHAIAEGRVELAEGIHRALRSVYVDFYCFGTFTNEQFDASKSIVLDSHELYNKSRNATTK